MPGQVEPTHPRGPRHALASAALYLLIAALYAASLGYAPSALDDRSQLAFVRGRDLAALLWSGDAFGHFRPLKNLLFAFLAGEPARVALVRCGVLAAVLASAALLQRIATALTGSPSVGLAAAALWALHPSTGTTLSWLSTANLVLALLMLLAYLACAARGAHGAALTALTLALAAHELACVAPLLALAYLRALGRPRPSLRGVLAVGSLLLVLGYLALQLVRAAPTHAYRGDVPSWLWSLSAARYVAVHVAMWLWPPNSFGVLLTDRPADHIAASIACWVGLIALGLAAFRARGRDRVRDFALVWVALTLLPVCNLAPFGNTPFALHYLYLPGVGLALAVAHAVARALARWPQRRTACAWIGAGLIALLFLPETVRAVAAWEDEPSLYRATLTNHPNELEVLSNLGSYHLGEGQLAEARPLLARAWERAPGDTGVLINLFALELASERPAAALALLDARPELAAQPEFAIRRGEALEQLGRDAEAAAAFARGYDAAGALGQPEQRYIGGYRCMVALVRLGRTAEAEALLARMLVEFPGREELRIARQLLREE